ncbi:MAG: 5-bromo-4-chloroindolyl phosphate hydrolysis family protein, partial [Treponema sp.]|nr:5-bromo-4-chloroindolyl phosphate hydrolysis family protein [Treponema sp.]
RSDKLYDLEKTSLSIFKKVKEEPELARKNQLRRLMSYYLPSSEKLLQSYVNMRNSTQNVENVEKSKRDIEEATDALNKAFTELLNQLFESTTSDISADISVMKTWMQQDALME